MELTHLQHRYLESLLQLRESGIDWGWFARRMARRWLMLTLIAVFAWFAVVPKLPTYGLLLTGVCFGSMLRDFAVFRTSRRTWPVVQEIIDWDRAERLGAG